MQSADLREPASHLKAPQELRSRLRHRLKACNSFSTVVTAGLQWLARLLSLICVPLQLKARLSGLRNSKYLSSVKSAAMERSPWWMNIDSSNLPNWKGPVGVKADGGGNIRGQGRVGGMRMHRAVHNKRLDDIVQLADAGVDVNEVEAAGNTPLHSAAFEGWLEGAQLLLQLGAKVNASNNAGDTPWHWAINMGHTELAAFLEANGASKQKGQVLVQEHVPKVKDFYSKECWAHHPPPYADFIDFKKQERAELEAERKKLVHA